MYIKSPTVATLVDIITVKHSKLNMVPTLIVDMYYNDANVGGD